MALGQRRKNKFRSALVTIRNINEQGGAFFLTCKLLNKLDSPYIILPSLYNKFHTKYNKIIK